MVILTLKDSEVSPQGGEPIWWGKNLVGLTTSAAYGYTLGCYVMMGYIKNTDIKVKKMIKIGGFEVEIACRRFSVEVLLESPYDPKGLALKR